MPLWGLVSALHPYKNSVKHALFTHKNLFAPHLFDILPTHWPFDRGKENEMALRFTHLLLFIVFCFYSSQFVSFVKIDSYLCPLDLNQMAKEPVCILVTGAIGQIRYALIPMIAKGVMLGHNQLKILHMLNIPPITKALNGVKMELVDAIFPLLKGVIATTDVETRIKKEDMERKDVI